MSNNNLSKVSRIALELADELKCYRTAMGDTYIEINQPDNVKIVKVESEEAISWLRYQMYGKNYALQKSQVQLVLDTIKAKAVNEGDEIDIFLRVACTKKAFYYDLNNDAGEVVKNYH